MKIVIKLLVLGAVIFLTACSSGGDSGPPPNNAPTVITLSGTAAAGSPIAGKVNVKGANGVIASSSIGIDGSFSLDVTALTAPYILYAEGSVNGKSISIYSVALSAGTINITPVTDFIVRNALSGAAETAYDSWGTTTVSDSALSTASSDVAIMLDALLSAVSATGVDLLTAPFKADGSGIDAALDALAISYSGTSATVVNTLTGSTIVDDITTAGVIESLPPEDTAAVTAVLTDATAINAVWQKAIDLFSAGRPSESDLTAWFMENVATDYLEDGLDRTAELNNWLSGEGPEVGFDIHAVILKPLTLAGYTRAYKIRLNYTGSITATFDTVMAFNGAAWLFYGNQKWIGYDVVPHAFMWVPGDGFNYFHSGLEFELYDDHGYAFSQGVHSAVVTGPGLPTGGVVMQYLDVENRFAIYGDPNNGTFYIISGEGAPNDAAIAEIHDNDEYTMQLCTQAAADIASGTGCDSVKTYTDTIMKPPVPLAELNASMFAGQTLPSSHDVSVLNFGGDIGVNWTKPTDVMMSDIGLVTNVTGVGSFDITQELMPNQTSTTLDARDVPSGTYEWTAMFIKVEDTWGRRFNTGWFFYYP